MKLQHIGILSSPYLAFLTIGRPTQIAIAQHQKLTCQAYGGSFVLDDVDFKALAASRYSLRDLPRGKAITGQQFASVTASSTDRPLCSIHALWRAIQFRKA